MQFLERLDDRLSRMGEIMSRSGAVFEQGHGYTLESGMRGAVWRCIFCRRSERCKTWFETASAANEPPDFCPNAGFFSQYRQTN